MNVLLLIPIMLNNGYFAVAIMIVTVVNIVMWMVFVWLLINVGPIRIVVVVMCIVVMTVYASTL